MVDIILVRSNSIIFDPRVDKIVSSLSKKYSMLVLGWDRDGMDKSLKYHVDVKLFRLRTSYWSPTLVRMLIRLLGFMTIFWLWVFIMLVIHRPKVIHACDLDTVVPCYLFRTLFSCKLVFDVFDRYAMIYIPMKFKKLYSFVTSIEERFVRGADVLIVAGGENVYRTFKRRPELSFVVLNCSIDILNKVSNLKQKESNSQMTLVYTGLIRANRSLDIVSTLINHMSGVQFIMAGGIYDKELYEQLIKKSNIHYRGVLHPTKALELEAKSDVMVALYDVRDPQNTLVIPNKTFESMMCGIPIITNIADYIIHETGCGILVHYDNPDEIRNAIVTLRDSPQLRRKLGENGRRAFLEKYNWNKMEQKLYEIYDKII